MVETNKRDFAEDGVKKVQKVISGPNEQKNKGKTVWANAESTRGKKVVDRTIKHPYEATADGMTKLPNLKR